MDGYMSQKFKKKMLILIIILTCLSFVIYYIYNQFYLSTDNGYVGSNVAQISSRLTGQIKHLYVVENQKVESGQILFELDPDTFQTECDQAKATLAVNEVNLKLTEASLLRFNILLKKRVVSVNAADNAEAAYQTAVAKVALATLNLAQKKLNLQYTKIKAPESGWVTRVTLRVGDVITSGQSLFALVGDGEFWVDANFKETELQDIHVGQPAVIKVDMYPNKIFNGVVESVSHGSGSAFSLLPPENATGNWVKVTQRVPVRIRIINPDIKYPLRVGTSANVTLSAYKRKL